jgi:hypothetical protein
MRDVRRPSDREIWLAIFEAASQKPGDEINDEWRWLLQQLRMPADDYLALCEALRQGRWRNAENPKAYVKRVVRLEVLHEEVATDANDPLVLMPATSEGEGPSVEQSLDHISYVRDTSEAVQGSDGIWRRGGGAEQHYNEHYDEDEDGNPISLRGRLLAKVPESLITWIEPSAEHKEAVEAFNASTNEWHLHAKSTVHVDLEKWAELAGFDRWEMQVLRYRLGEVSRDEALAEQSNDVSRKAIQAAWRRYDRTGKQRLREVAEKNLQKNVPEGAISHTR